MAKSKKKIDLIRDLLVISTAVLMILVVVFQWLEIKEFNLQGIIATRLKALFVSEAPPAPAAPAAPADGAPAAPGEGAPAAAPADGAPAPADGAPAGL